MSDEVFDWASDVGRLSGASRFSAQATMAQRNSIGMQVVGCHRVLTTAGCTTAEVHSIIERSLELVATTDCGRLRSALTFDASDARVAAVLLQVVVKCKAVLSAEPTGQCHTGELLRRLYLHLGIGGGRNHSTLVGQLDRAWINTLPRLDHNP